MGGKNGWRLVLIGVTSAAAFAASAPGCSSTQSAARELAARATQPLSVVTIPSPGRPIALAINATTNQLYVANDLARSVRVIDGNSNGIVKDIPVDFGINARPTAVAVNPVTNKISVALSGVNGVAVIDGSTNAVVG